MYSSYTGYNSSYMNSYPYPNQQNNAYFNRYETPPYIQPGFLSGFGTSVESISRISQILQTFSETLHVTFSSGVRLAESLGLFSKELSGIPTTSFRIILYFIKILNKLKQLIWKIIGKKVKTDLLHMKSVQNNISTNVEFKNKPTENSILRDINDAPSWVSVLFVGFGILQLIRRLLIIFFPNTFIQNDSNVKKYTEEWAILNNNASVAIVTSKKNGQKFAIFDKPNNQKCPIIQNPNGQLEVISPNGQSILIRQIYSSVKKENREKSTSISKFNGLEKNKILDLEKYSNSNYSNTHIQKKTWRPENVQNEYVSSNNVPSEIPSKFDTYTSNHFKNSQNIAEQ